jgi:hypothetical protein
MFESDFPFTNKKQTESSNGRKMIKAVSMKYFKLNFKKSKVRKSYQIEK